MVDKTRFSSRADWQSATSIYLRLHALGLTHRAPERTRAAAQYQTGVQGSEQYTAGTARLDQLLARRLERYK